MIPALTHTQPRVSDSNTASLQYRMRILVINNNAMSFHGRYAYLNTPANHDGTAADDLTLALSISLFLGTIEKI